MTVFPVLDAAGRRRSPATMPGYHAGHPPRNKGMRYPADPPTVDEIVAVMRHTPDDRHGRRLRAMIVEHGLQAPALWVGRWHVEGRPACVVISCCVSFRVFVAHPMRPLLRASRAWSRAGAGGEPMSTRSPISRERPFMSRAAASSSICWPASASGR